MQFYVSFRPVRKILQLTVSLDHPVLKIGLNIVHGFMNATFIDDSYDQGSLTINVHVWPPKGPKRALLGALGVP